MEQGRTAPHVVPGARAASSLSHVPRYAGAPVCRMEQSSALLDISAIEPASAASSICPDVYSIPTTPRLA